MQILSTRIVFLLVGLVTGAWATLIPFLQLRTGLAAGPLGMLLLCFGIGSIATMPLTGTMVARFGGRVVLVSTGLWMCVSLVLLAWLSNIPALVATLLATGCTIGAFDCAMNIQAVIVERRAGRPLMSGFHGMYSLGGIGGVLAATGLLTLGMTPLAMASSIAVCAAITILLLVPHLLAERIARSGPAIAIPRGIVLVIGLLCFVVFLAEGAMLDWSGIFLNRSRGLSAQMAGLGYGVFSVTMTLGRLSGDGIVTRLGRPRVVAIGGLLAASGFAIAVASPGPWAALIGFALIGAGAANIVPILFSSAARQTAMPEHLAIPAATTLGYAGVLAGPALIGFVAGISSLSVAFAGLAVALLAVAAGARLFR